MSGIASAIRGGVSSSSPFFAISSAMQPFRDGQEDLKNRVDELKSPLEETGTVFMSDTKKVVRGPIPFDRILYGSKGVTLNGNNQIVLGDKGVWRIDAMLTCTSVLAGIGINEKVHWQIEVKRPDGSLYHVKKFILFDDEEATMILTSTIICDSPGYTIEVNIRALSSNSRSFYGSPAYNHLTVWHLNREVSGNGDTDGSSTE